MVILSTNRFFVQGTIRCSVPALRLKLRPTQQQLRRMVLNVDIDEEFLKPFRRIGYNFIRSGVVEREVSDLTKLTREQKRLIPTGYLNAFAHDVSGQAHLRWMLQKDTLQQDTMLISSGGAGAVQCRRVAMAYAELVQRPVEVIHISPDTTVEDILQRRMMQRKSKKNSVPMVEEWDDSAGVRAALQGHILILDGLHRAERNVVSSLNSLLARREVPLGDGRVLVNFDLYQKLKQDDWLKERPKIFPINEDFRILALWSKNIDRLDPSVRSHFQIQRVDTPPSDVLYEQLLTYHSHESAQKIPDPNNENVSSHAFAIPDITNNIVIPDISDDKSARQLATLVSVMNDTILTKNSTFCFAPDAMHAIHRIRLHFPQTPLSDLLYRAYPYACNESRLRACIDMWPIGASSRTLFRLACQELGLLIESTSTTTRGTGPYELNHVEAIPGYQRHVLVHFKQQKIFNKQGIFASMFNDYSLEKVVIKVTSGGILPTSLHQKASTGFVSTDGSMEVLMAMIQEHFARRDILLISPRGEGKSTIANHFCNLLGYEAHVFTIRKDMTATDLMWKKSSRSSTGWTETPLLTAARFGQVCILDGIEKLSPDTFSVLQGMVTDRELVLPDSTKYSLGAVMEKLNLDVINIHDAFRVIALATIETPGTLITPQPPTWLSEEVTSMFATIPLPSHSRECLNLILKPQNEKFSTADLYTLYSFYKDMLEVSDDCGLLPLSIRSMKRFVKRGIIPDVMAGDGSLHGSLRSHVLYQMLRNTQRFAFECVALNAEIVGKIQSFTQKTRGIMRVEDLKIEIAGNLIKIGDVKLNRLHPAKVELVPEPVMTDSPNRITIIQQLIHDFSRGERSFMLIGNTETGMKHFCDGVCGLINHEREYINLSQKWTKDQLTQPPGGEGNRIESTLIRAMLRGYSLVIDGIDQADTEIKAMVKAIADEGILTLADGRRMLRDKIEDGLRIHPNFTLWVLTRRPTSLFYGDDFFHAASDSFSLHYVQVTEIETVIKDIRQSFPKVNESLIRRVFRSLDELRTLYESGDVDHPFSTKEALAVMKHLQMYPKDDTSMVLHDVLDFDSYDARQYSIFENLFKQYHFNVPSYDVYQTAINQSLRCGRLQFEYASRLDEQRMSETSTETGNSSYDLVSDDTRRDFGTSDDRSGDDIIVDDGKDDESPGVDFPDAVEDELSQNAIYSDGVEEDLSLNSRGKVDTVMFRPFDEKEIAYSLDDGEDERISSLVDEHIAKEKIENSFKELTKEVETDITQNMRLVSQLRAQELFAASLEKKGSSEYDEYRTFVDPIMNEVDELRHIFQQIPSRRRLCLLVDCSRSMIRLDPADSRLSRCMEFAALIMETCWGMEKKWDYTIVSHCGESSSTVLVPYGDAPVNGNERFRVLQKMITQSQLCEGGDNTLKAFAEAATSGKSDLVIVVSDAYLSEHDVDAESIIRTLRQCRSSTKIYFVFIAGLISEAIDIIDKLPKDRGFACTDSKDLPSILQVILENLEPTFPKQEGARGKILNLAELRERAREKSLK